MYPCKSTKDFYGDTENRDLKGKMTSERFEHLKQQISDANFDDEKKKLLLSEAELKILSSE
ncbi:hypothetical protein [Bacteroidetes bacterium endosymbiont of Geopemphigus sp.]|uniref:hypothetical protein n=1 Tax=Bacteroidetes bacterium endosymbiont of Geopemphigus sp. TaxID=2047937 RepID=UPI0011AF5948|nr:hypothetical protein [Bacteroidetes bacterium endosymbiont of Geopemphigus sp.]